MKLAVRILAASLIVGSGTLALAKEIEIDEVTINAAGTREGRAGFVPWSGVWWPFASCELALGWNATGGDFVYDTTAKIWSRVVTGKPVNDVAPFLKYDEYVKKVTGTDPKSAIYEATGDSAAGFRHNVYGDEKDRYDREGISYSWWGHCNGWCAAALMEKEPIAPIEARGIRFEVADLKGLLTEVFWGVQSDFTGRRFNTMPPRLSESRQPGIDLLTKLNAGTPAAVGSYIAWYEKAYNRTISASVRPNLKPSDFKTVLENFEKYLVDSYDKAYSDVNPDVFHRILETVIGRKKLAFVADITANEEVWNHPAFAYTMSIAHKRDFSESGQALKEWDVTTTVWYATDGVSESILGISDFTETYTYTLVTGPTGKILRGAWTGDSVDRHPDFCWLPISNPLGPDTGENKKVEYGRVLSILPVHHGQREVRGIDLTANGTKASTRRPNDRTTTWSNAIACQGEVTFSIARTTSRTITKVTYVEEPVEDDWGDVIASRDPVVAIGTSTTGPTFELKATLAGSGKKMIVAYAYDGAGRLIAMDEVTLAYGSTVPGNNGTDDAFEPNNTRGAAMTIQPGTTPNLQCKDDDWYKVVLTQPSNLTVAISFSNSEGDLDLKLEGPAGQVAASETTDDVETCEGKNLPAGTYYVHAFGYEGARAKYSLTLTITPAATTPPPADDQFEQNDDRATARSIAPGTYANLRCEDEDWYKVTVAANGRVEAKIDFRNAEGDLDMHLVDANGNAIKKSESTSDRETVLGTGLAAGTYYVRVFGYRGAKAGYSLTISP